MEKLAGVFCPYFGKLPSNFNLWLKSASYNHKIDFFIITDDKREFETPLNVKIFNVSFSDFRSKVQSLFDFKISLSNPYKLCDYKPTFGYIFADIINKNHYQWWGHCDLDVIFGDLCSFLPDDIEKYGKINYAAHFCLYKNTPEIVNAFMNVIDSVNYKTILSSPIHFAFDEIGNYSINAILKNNGILIYEYEKYVARITCLRSNLDVGVQYNQYENKTTSYDRNKKIFTFEKGKVFDYSIVNGKLKQREWAYIHIQKRRMDVKVTENSDSFLICANTYEPYQEPNVGLILSKQVSSFYPRYLEVKYNAGLRKIKRMVAIYRIRKNKKGG